MNATDENTEGAEPIDDDRMEIVNEMHTVSILRSFLIVADGEIYALPVANVLESARIGQDEDDGMNHALFYRWKDEVLPILDFAALAGRPVLRRQSGIIFVIQADNRRRALLADEAIGIREIVVEGLDSIAGSAVGISGVSTLDDGRVAFILDPRGLVALSLGPAPAASQRG